MTALRPATVLAEPVNFEPMAAHAEAVIGRHLFQHSGNHGVMKFDQLATLAANEMVVLRVTVIVLVDFAAIGDARHVATGPLRPSAARRDKRWHG